MKKKVSTTIKKINKFIIRNLLGKKYIYMGEAEFLFKSNKFPVPSVENECIKFFFFPVKFETVLFVIPAN